MAALTTQKLVDAGTAPTFGDSSASDTAEVGSGLNTFLVYRNTGASSAEVTIDVPGNTSYGEPTPNKVVTLGAGDVTPTEAWIPLRKEYNSGNGRAVITATNSGATLKVAVVRVG